MVHPFEGEDTFDMGDSTNRRQPIHYRVSPVTRRTLHSFMMKLKLFIMTQQAGYPLRGKSSGCVMCLKYRTILLIFIIISLSEILVDFPPSTRKHIIIQVPKNACSQYSETSHSEHP